MSDGAITVKAGRAEPYPTINTLVAQAIEEGVALQRRYDDLKDQLDARKGIIREYILGLKADAKSIKLTLEDGSRADVTLEDKAAITDPVGIKVFLGDRYKDLVKEETTYDPRSALVAMASDKQVPESERAQLLTLLAIKSGTPGVKFEKGKS